MKKEPRVFLQHIIESIEDIEEYTQKLTKEEFLKKKYLQDATIRRIEIIGEAIKNLPSEFTKKYTFVPWKDISGMRDKVVHHYFGVDLAITWKAIKEDIPVLKENILKILAEVKAKEQTKIQT